MRTMLRPVVLVGCLLGPGCQFMCHVGKNLWHEPTLACDEKQLKHRNVKYAKQAWNAMVKQYGECFSCDYRRGFVDGFADYLTFGGCVGDPQGGCGGGNGSCHTGADVGTPSGDSCGANGGGCGRNGSGGYTEYPVCATTPPERYQRKRYTSPEGCQAIEEWFAGFRHGAATAMASGLRNLQLVPVQCPPVFSADDGAPPAATTRPAGATAPAKESPPPMPPPDEITQPGADTLPPPRTAGDADAKPPVLPPPGR